MAEVWDKIKTSLSKDDDIQEIKSEIQKLQEEIEKLKSENKKLKEEKEIEKTPGFMQEYFDKLDETIQPVKDLLDKIFEENKSGVAAISTCITKARIPNSSGFNIGTSCIYSIDDLQEEGLAAACEVFTNPRRIAILKALFKEHLTASEIGQKTGLVGGQLYHHLSSLENAALIQKDDDKYKSDNLTLAMLSALHATIGGMKIAKG